MMYRQQNCVCVCVGRGDSAPAAVVAVLCLTFHIVATGFLHHWFDVSTINCFDKRNAGELLHVEVYD